ncbi:MAG TPA: sigma-54 dependent transcriptional regulator [Dyella sp.]|uniref:sigma-54 dependent transcriptional regulator n=1 Tax=Dyella sp. TaxID=1869338 RepID=UPI002D797397|nr:sigma-54 dependent transcriptional regulator [Dyella sp.]HET6554608.1 sigma-54 dependent transcriptional regulator [Dyella sp.]
MTVMLGQSSAFLRLREQLRRYAECDIQVLIEGETGTGKELAAREIHYASARSGRPFVPVNCGALPDNLIENELFGHERGAYTDARCAQPGLIDHARGGTLFLDEVDTLSSKAQVTLLRFLENNEYRPVGGGSARVSNARVIAATNSCLDEEVAAGRFRRDLQYRLNALNVRMPPLRERTGDVELLAAHFLEIIAHRLDGPAKRWSAEAMHVLCVHAWPGNVRELENVVLRAYMQTDDDVIDGRAVEELACAGVIAASEDGQRLDGDVGYHAARHQAIHVFEQGYLLGLMVRTQGNVTAAARLSGTERRQLGKLLKKHGIDTRRFRTQP